MGETTGISWTSASWNPWHGCHKVSDGCKLCYMFSDKKRYGQDPNIVVRSKSTFNDPLKWKDGRMIFTCSWSDFFIEEADAWRDEVWEIIRKTPRHTYQILTKRPERMAVHLPSDWDDGYANVWLGVSAENQKTADERIPLLLDTRAAVRWVSAEPLLAPIDFDNFIYTRYVMGGERHMYNQLNWVVVGGESGAGARPFNWMWAQDIIRQCKSASVPVFMKQLDSNPVGGMGDKMPLKDRKGGDMSEWIEELRVREFPSAAAEGMAI